MKKNSAWPHLNNITVISSPYQPSVEICQINLHGVLKLRLLLLPANMFSVGWHASDGTADDVLVALGRLIANHGELAADRRQLDAEFETLEEIGRNEPRPSWSDLPDLHVTPAEARGRLICSGLRTGGDAATLFLTFDTVIPMGWAALSTATPSRSLLIGISRLVIARAGTFLN